MKAKSYIVIGCLLGLLACSETVTVVPFTYPEVFTGKTSRSWTIRNYQLLRDGKGTLTGGLSSCESDNTYTFYNTPERTYQITDGSKKCNASDPNVLVDSSWSFINSTATLTIVMPLFSESPLPFIVKEVDDTKMVLDIYLDDSRYFRLNLKSVSSD
jgi:hypothetical protein